MIILNLTLLMHSWQKLRLIHLVFLFFLGICGRGAKSKAGQFFFPSMFSVNEIVIGVSTIDVLSHLINEDIRSPSVVQVQSLGLSEYLIQQRSFYPLSPSAEGAPVDITRRNLLEIPEKVDVLICPSKLSTF
jgi:hypothetical protein